DRRILFSGLPENAFARVTLKFFRHGHAFHCLLAVFFQNLNHPRNRGGFRRTRVAIVQCAVSVAACSPTGASPGPAAPVSGASSGTAAAVVVVSAHSIGSGLRVIARASTSSMRETGTMSRPFLMLSLISTRSRLAPTAMAGGGRRRCYSFRAQDRRPSQDGSWAHRAHVTCGWSRLL